ncbi:protease inhibitor I42 family protein [Pseudomonas syringae]|nr:protease inhibitor I42 family protein [Pseudomonas syringae]MBD8789427.1 protease inhibitor I42 family protein [Pseudomonas syringae]MBD8800149.1 protease inhibitor I42 family protein [Pseudomonas syringae]MBD8810855.1 protease inhibitor I42 family protein [Pseudomonas syringae]
MTSARLLAPISLVLLTACAHTPDAIVSLDDQGDCPLALTRGQTLILSLPSNPSTGFRWQVREPAAGILRSLGPEVYNADKGADVVVGSGGQSVWRYKATEAGTARLLLDYKQPWEPEAAPQNTFECLVRVI